MAKPFPENRQPWILEVAVTWDGPEPFGCVDQIKGLNPGHALWNARQNWPDASEIRVWSERMAEEVWPGQFL